MLNIEDHAALREYMTARGWIAPGEDARIATLKGGVSCRTVLVERPLSGDCVVKQALAALRVATEWLSSPERSAREAEGARALAGILPRGAVPEVLFEDRAEHLFGMRAAPREAVNWKTLLLSGAVDPALFAQAGELLGRIHRQGAGYEEAFADRSFFESLRLNPYYEYAATQAPEAADFLTALAADTRRRREALVHGDYSPKNILVHAGRLILLDHEVIHFGDPAFDLGFSMAHFLSKAHHMPPLRKALLEGAAIYWRLYAAGVAGCAFHDLEARAVRHTLGCLLARVAGRSPLEYLGDEERARQRTAVVRLMWMPPERVSELLEEFIEEVDSCR